MVADLPFRFLDAQKEYAGRVPLQLNSVYAFRGKSFPRVKALAYDRLTLSALQVALNALQGRECRGSVVPPSGIAPGKSKKHLLS